jgi:PilZ domain
MPDLDGLRTVQRYLIVPALPALFGPAGDVMLHELSEHGARIRHKLPIPDSAAGTLRFGVSDSDAAVDADAIVVWTHDSGTDDDRNFPYVSGVTLRSGADDVNHALEVLRSRSLAAPISELRAADRYILKPPLPGTFEEVGAVVIKDLSELGARLEHSEGVKPGSRGLLSFSVPGQTGIVSGPGRVVWSRVKTLSSFEGTLLYSSGVDFEIPLPNIRTALTLLAQQKIATPDVESLRIKMRIIQSKQDKRRKSGE